MATMNRIIPANHAKLAVQENGENVLATVGYELKSVGSTKTGLTAFTVINAAPTPPIILFDSTAINCCT